MQTGQTQAEITSYMSWIPLVFGSLGLLGGGKLADLTKKKYGVKSSVGLMAATQILASPYAVGVLYLQTTASYFFLIPVYLIGRHFDYQNISIHLNAKVFDIVGITIIVERKVFLVHLNTSIMLV